MILIIASNNRLNTFGNSIRRYSSSFKDINHIFLLRTTDKESQKPPNWKSVCENYFPELEAYSEIKIKSAQEYPEKIPMFFNKEIFNAHIDTKNVLIDLTNGTKTWCDMVSLICTLSQINNLYRIKVPKEEFNTPYEDLGIGKIELSKEPVLDGNKIRKYANLTYSEYIFFLNEILTFKKWISESSLINEKQKDEIQVLLMSAFELYVNGNFQSSIVKSGTFLEEFLEQILEKIKQLFPREWNILTNNHSYGVTFGSKARALGIICTRTDYIVSGVNNGFTQSSGGSILKNNSDVRKLSPIIPIGTICQSLGYIRNFSSHGSPDKEALRTDLDARQFLLSILYILGKIKQCEILR